MDAGLFLFFFVSCEAASSSMAAKDQLSFFILRAQSLALYRSFLREIRPLPQRGAWRGMASVCSTPLATDASSSSARKHV